MSVFFYRTFLVFLSIFLMIYLFDFLTIKTVRPDLVLIVLTYIAYRKGAFSGEITGFFSGLSEDFLFSSLLGIHAFSNFITGYITGKFVSNFVIDNFFIQFFIIFIVSIINNTIFLLAALVFTNINFFDYLSLLLIKTLYTAFVGVFLWYFLVYFERKTGEI